MATIFYTGCSLDGFIATSDHDLAWLTSRDIDAEQSMGFETFRPRIGSAVMGASTWQWMLDNGEKTFMAGVPSVVLSHREFEPVPKMTFLAADSDEALRNVHGDLVAAAGDKDVWVVGGGPLAARLASLGLVDEFWIQFAPVTLGSGQPVCPEHVELRLEDVVRNGDFVCTRYCVLSRHVGVPTAGVRESRSDLPLPQGPRHGERLRAAARPRRNPPRRTHRGAGACAL